MTELWTLLGAGLLLLGAFILIYGALRYHHLSRITPPLPAFRAFLRSKFRRYKIACLIVSIAGCAMLMLSALPSGHLSAPTAATITGLKR